MYWLEKEKKGGGRQQEEGTRGRGGASRHGGKVIQVDVNADILSMSTDVANLHIHIDIHKQVVRVWTYLNVPTNVAHMAILFCSSADTPKSVTCSDRQGRSGEEKGTGRRKEKKEGKGLQVRGEEMTGRMMVQGIRGSRVRQQRINVRHASAVPHTAADVVEEVRNSTGCDVKEYHEEMPLPMQVQPV